VSLEKLRYLVESGQWKLDAEVESEIEQTAKPLLAGSDTRVRKDTITLIDTFITARRMHLDAAQNCLPGKQYDTSTKTAGSIYLPDRKGTTMLDRLASEPQTYGGVVKAIYSKNKWQSFDFATMAWEHFDANSPAAARKLHKEIVAQPNLGSDRKRGGVDVDAVNAAWWEALIGSGSPPDNTATPMTMQADERFSDIDAKRRIAVRNLLQLMEEYVTALTKVKKTKAKTLAQPRGTFYQLAVIRFFASARGWETDKTAWIVDQMQLIGRPTTATSVVKTLSTVKNEVVEHYHLTNKDVIEFSFASDDVAADYFAPLTENNYPLDLFEHKVFSVVNPASHIEVAVASQVAQWESPDTLKQLATTFKCDEATIHKTIATLRNRMGEI
jgi:hypothetical protein